MATTAQELRELSDVELDEKLDEFKADLFNLRFEMATGQLDNYKRLNQVRREIARVMTIQRERAIADAAEAAGHAEHPEADDAAGADTKENA